MHFVHELDQSLRLLIVESLTAAPLQGSGKLSVSMKLDKFVRENSTYRLAGAPHESVGDGQDQSHALFKQQTQKIIAPQNFLRNHHATKSFIR